MSITVLGTQEVLGASSIALTVPTGTKAVIIGTIDGPASTVTLGGISFTLGKAHADGPWRSQLWYALDVRTRSDDTLVVTDGFSGGEVVGVIYLAGRAFHFHDSAGRRWVNEGETLNALDAPPSGEQIAVAAGEALGYVTVSQPSGQYEVANGTGNYNPGLVGYKTGTGALSVGGVLSSTQFFGSLAAMSLVERAGDTMRVQLQDSGFPLLAIEDDPDYEDEDDRTAKAQATTSAQTGATNSDFSTVPDWAAEADTEYELNESDGVVLDGWRPVNDGIGRVAWDSSSLDPAEGTGTTGFTPALEFFLDLPGGAADELYVEQYVPIPRSVNTAHHFFADFTTYECSDSLAETWMTVEWCDNEFGDGATSAGSDSGTAVSTLEVDAGVPSSRSFAFARVRIGFRRNSSTVACWAYLTGCGHSVGMLALPLKYGTYSANSTEQPTFTASGVTYPLGRPTVTSTSDPTSTDDAGAGYHVGTTWLNTATSEYFTSTDSTDDAAVWLRERNAGRWELLVADGITAPPDPLTNEDEDDFLYGWTAD